MVSQQRVELAEDVGERIGVAEIEDELVAPEHRFVALGDQRPVRMVPVQVAVGVDHLGFDPDPELHAQAGDMVDQRPEAIWVDVGGNDPVAEAGGVVSS